jgi:hypothetical protein
MTRGRWILTCLQSVAVFCCLLALVAVTAGCSSSLREVRARGPEFQVQGVPASRQFEVARCIRDVLDEGVGDLSILQEIEQEPDGMHVIGRPEETPSAALFDVAIREDAVVAMMASAPVISRDTLRDAITICVGAKREQAR